MDKREMAGQLAVASFVLIVSLLLAILVAHHAFFGRIYPNATKEPGSYEKLCRTFENSGTVFLPDGDDIPVDSCLIRLDGKTFQSKPVGYYVTKQEKLDGFQVQYELHCGEERYPFDGNGEYRGVSYNVHSHKGEYGSGARQTIYFVFDLEDRQYEYNATYQCESLTMITEEEQALEEQITGRLETYAKQVIDKYVSARVAG